MKLSSHLHFKPSIGYCCVWSSAAGVRTVSTRHDLRRTSAQCFLSSLFFLVIALPVAIFHVSFGLFILCCNASPLQGYGFLSGQIATESKNKLFSPRPGRLIRAAYRIFHLILDIQYIPACVCVCVCVCMCVLEHIFMPRKPDQYFIQHIVNRKQPTHRFIKEITKYQFHLHNPNLLNETHASEVIQSE